MTEHPRKIAALLRGLTEARKEAERRLDAAAAACETPEPPPFDDDTANARLASAAVNDAINGTSTEATMRGEIEAARAACEKARSAWAKSRAKADQESAQARAVLLATDTRIKAADAALRGELAALAVEMKPAMIEAFNAAVETLFKLAAEIQQLDDMEAAADGRALEWVTGNTFPAAVIAPFWTHEGGRDIEQPPGMKNEARRGFLLDAGVTESTEGESE